MDDLTVQDALQVLYKKYDLQTDGGVNNPSVEIRIMRGVTFYLPNFQARRKVVLRHDVHHLVTGYSAVMKGEIEISAWEISTGCTQNWFALVINSLGMMSGIPFNLPGVWRAWFRGRSSTNLYAKQYTDKELLSKKVGDLKTDLRLNDVQPRVTITGLIALIGFLVFGLILSVASFILIPFILIYSLIIHFSK